MHQDLIHFSRNSRLPYFSPSKGTLQKTEFKATRNLQGLKSKPLSALLESNAPRTRRKLGRDSRGLAEPGARRGAAVEAELDAVDAEGESGAQSGAL